MEAVLVALIITAPVIALTTGVYLWGRRHSTPEWMRYRVLQAALLVVAAAALAYVVLILQGARDDLTRREQIEKGLEVVVPFMYLTKELRSTRKRLKSTAQNTESPKKNRHFGESPRSPRG